MKSLIEELIRNGDLQEYVLNPQNNQGQKASAGQGASGEKAKAPVDTRPVINTISGVHTQLGTVGLIWRGMPKS